MPGPLDDLRIVDLSRIVAGPLATQRSRFSEAHSRRVPLQIGASRAGRRDEGPVDTHRVERRSLRSDQRTG